MGSLRPDRRQVTSRIGGVPTAVPPPTEFHPEGQLGLGIVETPPPRDRAEPVAGAVHVPDWLSLDDQRALVRAFRRWARPPAGLRHPRMPTGDVMSVQSVCLGWHW